MNGEHPKPEAVSSNNNLTEKDDFYQCEQCGGTTTPNVGSTINGKKLCFTCANKAVAAGRTSKDVVQPKKIYWIDPRLPKAEYDRQWIEGIKARCIITESGCWEWTRFCHGFRNIKPGQRGYGNASYRGKGVRTHRKMLEIKLGRDLPRELHACHTCDNPPCCNPDHLYAATNQQNHLDGGKRGRMNGQWKTHCKHGHEFTPENTYWSPRPNGSPVRNCKECNRIRLRRAWADGRGLARQRRWRAQKKAQQQASGQ